MKFQAQVILLKMPTEQSANHKTKLNPEGPVQCWWEFEVGTKHRLYLVHLGPSPLGMGSDANGPRAPLYPLNPVSMCMNSGSGNKLVNPFSQSHMTR